MKVFILVVVWFDNMYAFLNVENPRSLLEKTHKGIYLDVTYYELPII